MDYELKFQFKLYQNNFKQPLRTNHGIWKVREGIIISLTNPEGITTKGEIAPLPWFGSETMAQAVAFCQQLGNATTREAILTIPDHLPCCQFALESASLALDLEATNCSYLQDLDFCYLLPAGTEALTVWQDLYQVHGATTFKWKIGVLTLSEEINILKQLTTDLPAQVKLRLDANGGLNLTQAQQLLSVTDSLQGIEFIEQPLPPDNFANMLQLSQEHTTLLALDESVASFSQLEQAYEQGWGGVYVIKAAIMGFPDRLRQFCQNNALDVVFSSVLETEVGREAVLKLIRQLHHPRASGFGVQHLY
ncbi:MAG: o-succinylbenzoate synthase [Pleurocapsa sp. SU_5_0]|nr:o-succinylbenzoate synthase [Pleurocapsa sp. SU_5_0]